MRPDETPVRAGSAPVGSVPSPGTPPGAGQTQGGLLPSGVRQAKFASRYQRFLQAVGTAVARYSGTILPAMVLNQLHAEDYYPEEPWFAGSAVLAQSAAAYNIIQILPPTAGVVTLDRLVVTRLNTAGEVDVWFQAKVAAPLVTPNGGPITRDNRGRVVGLTAIGKQPGAALAPTNYAAVFSGVASVPAELRGYVLGVVPGMVLTIQCPTVNEGVAVYYEGRLTS